MRETRANHIDLLIVHLPRMVNAFLRQIQKERILKFLLVDDHALFREGMKYMLSEMEEDALILEANTSRKAIEIAKNRPDINLILMDLNMPDMDGISAMKEILLTTPTVLIVILTASERLSDMRTSLQGGAMGYLAKSVSPDIMSSALRLVLSGGLYIPPALITQTGLSNTTVNTGATLTPRQTEVVRLIADGQSNKQIAHFLSLSEATVKVHISAIFKTLNVNNRTQAANAAKKLNL